MAVAKAVAILGGLIIVLVGILAVVWAWYAFTSAAMVRRFRRVHGRAGKFLLLVYSDSPNWKAYIDEHILPQVAPYAVLLNWSQRSTWGTPKPLEVRIFERWGGNREFNPLAIVIPRTGKIEVIRFWQAFRDFKHGKPLLLQKQQERLLERVHELARA